MIFSMLHLSNNLKEKKYKYWLSRFAKSWQREVKEKIDKDNTLKSKTAQDCYLFL